MYTDTSILDPTAINHHHQPTVSKEPLLQGVNSMLCRRKFWRMKIAGGPFCRMRKPRGRCPVLWIYSFWYPTRCWFFLIMRRKRIFWKWKAHQHSISSLWFSYLESRWFQMRGIPVSVSFQVLGVLTLYLEANLWCMKASSCTQA
jgi:hypothetical protein